MSRKGLEQPCRFCGKPVSSWGPNRDRHPECRDPSIKEANKAAQLARKADLEKRSELLRGDDDE